MEVIKTYMCEKNSLPAILFIGEFPVKGAGLRYRLQSYTTEFKLTLDVITREEAIEVCPSSKYFIYDND